MLSGIVNNRMAADLRNGDVFIFVNKNRNRIKLLRKEPGGLVIYAMMLDYGRLRLPSCEQGAVSRALEWRDLAGMIRHPHQAQRVGGYQTQGRRALREPC